jgi:hypothetical protein
LFYNNYYFILFYKGDVVKLRKLISKRKIYAKVPKEKSTGVAFITFEYVEDAEYISKCIIFINYYYYYYYYYYYLLLFL